MTFLKLKPLTAEQLDAVVQLDHLCFGGLWTRTGYEREIESPNSQLLILEAASSEGASELGEPSSEISTQNLVGVNCNPMLTPTSNRSLVGLGCFWSILEEAHITILAVHPDYQSQGLGQLLLYALLREAKRCQMEWATLEVKPSNQRALSVYQKFGFIEAGRRRGYYKDTGEDALILWRNGLQTREFEETLANRYQHILHQITSKGWQLPRTWDAQIVAGS